MQGAMKQWRRWHDVGRGEAVEAQARAWRHYAGTGAITARLCGCGHGGAMAEAGEVAVWRHERDGTATGVGEMARRRD